MALRLSPVEPLIYYAAFTLALAYLLTDRPEEAVAHARKTIEGDRNFALPYCIPAAAYARLERAEEASQAVQRLIRLAPSFRLGSLPRTVIGRSPGLRHDGLTAPFVIDRAMNDAIFLAYVEQCLASTLSPGDIVVMGNLPAHWVAGVRHAIRARVPNCSTCRHTRPISTRSS
jgi:tetratricopeptide (TPR) repeat protein